MSFSILDGSQHPGERQESGKSVGGRPLGSFVYITWLRLFKELEQNGMEQNGKGETTTAG